jgi:DNA-binding MarR family transcriptional regulator
MEHQSLEEIEFSDKPSVLVLADGASARREAILAAELAGCRVSDVIGLEGAVERLGRQAGLDAVVVELEQDGGEELDRLLQWIEQSAQEGHCGSVVCAPAALIDLVAARTRHQKVIHLCEPDGSERVAAVALASARSKHRLHDIGKEQEPPRLLQFSEEVGRIASVLASLSEAQREAAEQELEGKGPGKVEAGHVRAIIRARRLRDQYFGSELFADPAWDILLDLFAAQLENRKVAVSSLCIAAAVPATTALRWIKTLTDLGLVVRAADPQDGRRVYIELAPRTAEGVEACLKAAMRISPLII